MDGSIQIYDSRDLTGTADPTPVAALPPSKTAKLSLAFGNGARLVFQSSDGALAVHDLARGADGLARPDQILECRPERVWSLAVSPAGSRVAAGFEDGHVMCWDTSTSPPVATTWKGHEARVVGLTFAPDGRTLATASYDNSIAIVDPSSGTRLRQLVAHYAPVTSIAFSRDGRQLVSTSIDMAVKIWDPAKGTPLASLRAHNGAGSGVAFSPDGTRFATSSAGPDDPALAVERSDRALDLARPRGRRTRGRLQPGWQPAGVVRQ